MRPRRRARTDRSACTLQVEHQQALRFHQALGEELVDRQRLGAGWRAAVLRDALVAQSIPRPSRTSGKRVEHQVEIVAGDADDLDVVERGAGRGAQASAEQRRSRRSSPPRASR